MDTPRLMPIQVAPGEWKSLGDCTGEDMKGAAAVADEAVSLQQRIVAAFRTMSGRAGTSPVGTFSAPAWVAEDEDEDLLLLRRRAEVAEAWATRGLHGDDA